MCYSPLVPPAASSVLLTPSATQSVGPPLPVVPVHLFVVLSTYHTYTGGKLITLNIISLIWASHYA